MKGKMPDLGTDLLFDLEKSPSIFDECRAAGIFSLVK